MVTVLITGGSSGIGLATAQKLAELGFNVYEMSRKPFLHDKIRHISGDITSESDIKYAIERIIFESGSVDILINNAGFGISGAVEFTSIEDAKRQFDVNFFGMVRVTNAVLPHMRKNGGRIINLSSVAAAVPIPFQAFYSASKAAINSYTLSLANELRPFKISVTAIMPGDIHTGFTSARKKEQAGDDIYCGRISRSVAKMEKDETNGMKPETIGKFIAKIATKKRIKPLYAIRVDYKFFVILSRILPVRILNGIVYLLYAK